LLIPFYLTFCDVKARVVAKIKPTTARSKNAAAQARARPVSNPAVKFEKMKVGSVAKSP
jgi:hypothetical protein